jgi:hypothetical protein
LELAAMTDRPILFSAPMVRALVAGTKTQTRRVSKVVQADGAKFIVSNAHGGLFGVTEEEVPTVAPDFVNFCVGDRLWVRETWWHPEPYSYGTLPSGEEIKCPRRVSKSAPTVYAADGDPPNCANRHYGPEGLVPGSGHFAAPDPWAVWTKRSSIHMPRWVSRLTLTVTEIRVERLQDISAKDSIAEGVECDTCIAMRVSACQRLGCFASIGAYGDLWDSIHGARAWAANPWVAALTFTVEHRNIDAPALAGAVA